MNAVCFSRYVLSGFELQLYGLHERNMAWWYLDYLLNYAERTHTGSCERRAAAFDARGHASGGGGGGGSKSNKKGKKAKAKKQGAPNHSGGPKSKSPTLESEFAEVLQCMTRGVLRALDGCDMIGISPTLASEFTSTAVLYHHRFAVLEALEQPQYVSYPSFARSKGAIRERVVSGEFKPEALFVMAYHHFDAAMKSADALLQGRTLPPGMKAQLLQLIRVARGNSVSLRFSSMPGGHPTVKMDFADHPCFPVLKFR